VKRLAESSAVRSGAVTVDCTDAAIAEAWAAVRDDAAATNWLLLKYESKARLVLAGSGAGGLAELRAALDDGAVMYGAFRCSAVDDAGSKRAKFCFVTWVGESVGGMARARASQHAGTVKRVIDGTHMDITAMEPAEIEEGAIRARIIAGSGAHAPKEVEF
jgi:hypothetical protein